MSNPISVACCHIIDKLFHTIDESWHCMILKSASNLHPNQCIFVIYIQLFEHVWISSTLLTGEMAF